MKIKLYWQSLYYNDETDEHEIKDGEIFIEIPVTNFPTNMEFSWDCWENVNE
jgi:hypothetical protein